MKQAKNISEVIVLLDEIIAECEVQNSRKGYFACLYRKMTIAVKKGIDNGTFDDGARMEELDVVFANRYIAAYYQNANNESCTASWQYAFTATTQQYTVIQHLLLGMNAHINLDLGIAAATISEGQNIQSLKSDFDKINDVIGSLINEVQTDIEDICFPMKFVRLVDNKAKDDVINFSITIARKTAWQNAINLSINPKSEWEKYCEVLDIAIENVAKKILNPKISHSLLLKIVQIFEPKEISKIMVSLKN